MSLAYLSGQARIVGPRATRMATLRSRRIAHAVRAVLASKENSSAIWGLMLRCSIVTLGPRPQETTMPSLGDTTAMLRRARGRAAAGASQSRRPDGPASRMVESTAFGGNPGALRMLTYVPTGLARGAPLVIVLHGCTQGAGAYARDAGWLTLAERHGFVVVAAEQTAANNPNRCFNWFSPGDTRRGHGEAASIAAMAAYAVAEHELDAERVFVTGLSAGGAMTAVMLATYPDVFAGGAVIAGLAYGVAGNVSQALQAMSRADRRSAPELGAMVRGAAPLGGRIPRIAIWHGSADATVAPANADDLARQWAWTHGLPVEPSETRELPRRTQAIWRSPTMGEVMIESNLVQGLGHGAPLAAAGAEGLGATAPYMLEAGISSSLEILRFWGLAESTSASALVDEPEPEAKAESGEPTSLGRQVMALVTPRVPGGVQDAIEKALRSAGLMR